MPRGSAYTLIAARWMPRLTWLMRCAPFLIPSIVMLGAAQRANDDPSTGYLGLGAGVLFVVALCAMFASASWRQPIGPAVIMLHLTALGWLIFGTRGRLDWYLAFSQSVLLIFPLLTLGYQTLRGSGVMEARRAQTLAGVIQRRADLPLDPAVCRELPEVKAFREALHGDATPALALLAKERNEVRLAALCALEFRKNWRKGEAALILRLAQKNPEPAVRAAAIMALGNVDERELVEKLAEFLRDPAAEVRRAAATALLWDSEHRWAWIRPAVQHALADGELLKDGSLWQSGQMLAREAIADLQGWAAASGALGVRAAITLAAHYRRALLEGTDPALLHELRHVVLNTQSPITLRHELAHLLCQQDELPVEHIELLLQSSNPAPLRLFAADALLARGDHLEAVHTLREMARVANREIALATAGAVQRRLGVDLGLDLQAPLPALHTRQAADITRRVMRWAAEQDAADSMPERVADSATHHV